MNWNILTTKLCSVKLIYSFNLSFKFIAMNGIYDIIFTEYNMLKVEWSAI